MELAKKIPVPTEEEEEKKEEKEPGHEKKETNSLLSGHGNYRIRSIQCCGEEKYPFIISYLSAILKNSTPPPEQA